MKLECPSCHQKYRLTNQTIPADKTVVACRACTKPIPLQKISAKQGQPAPSIQSVTCGYCGKKVAITAVQATESKEISCPACKHPIVISGQQASAPVAAKPSFEGVHLKCSQCQQTYTLNRAKIPANAASATCKACGSKIPIPGSLARHHRAGRDSEGTQAVGCDRSAVHPQAVRNNAPVSIASVSATQKTWFRAFLALMLAALIGFGIWFGGGWLLDMFKTGWEVLIESKPRPTMKTPSGTFSSRPLLAMRLNTPLVMHAIDGRIARNSAHRKTMVALSAVGLERVEVFMLPQSELLVVPALFLQGREIRHLDKLLAGYSLIEKAVYKTAAGQYVIDLETLGKKYGNGLPAITYTIWFHGNTILMAPEVLMKDPAVTLSRLTESRVADFAGTFTGHSQAGTIAVKIPSPLDSDWPAKLRGNPVMQADPRLAMTTRMGASVLSQLGDTLDAIEMLGADLSVTGEARQRLFHYRQRFHSRSAAKNFNAQLEAADAGDQSAQWLVREMLALFQHRQIEYSFDLDGKDLDVHVKWLPDHDQLIMNALIRAMFGKVVEPKATTFGRMEPSMGSVRTITMDLPPFSLSLDDGELKKLIPPAFDASLFPGQYWEGAEPHMNIDLDTALFPNNVLTEATYEVLSVKSVTGGNILRQSDQKVQHTLKPGSPMPGFVAVDIKAQTPANSLGTATIRFYPKVPTRLDQVEFTTLDAPGTTRVAGSIPVKLKRLEKDIVEIVFHNNPGVFMFAFNAAGKTLAISETKQSGNVIAMRFHGIIHRAMVLVVKEQLEMPFDLKLDLNRGQAYRLAHKPETPNRSRFDSAPLLTYRNLGEADMQDLSVQWEESAESEWFDKLSIDLPQGPFHGRADWEVNFFGRDKPVLLSGKAENVSHKISYRLDKGALQKANAAVGRVAVSMSTNIARQHFVKISDRTPVIQKIPSGKIVTVIFDQNEITLTPCDDATVQIIAYDADNRRLKRDSFSQTKGLMRKYYYWGVPTSVDVDIAGNRIKKTVDFDIIKRQLDQEAYEAFKQQLAIQPE